MRIELIESPNALPLSAEAWNSLVSRNETNTIFQTFEWFDAWWSVFAEDAQLFFLAVLVDSEIVGFAPLMIRRRALGLRQLEFVGAGSSDYQDFVTPTRKAEQITTICDFLRRNTNRWDKVLLGNLPDRSSTARLLGDCAADNRLHVVEQASVACPALVLDGHREYAQALIDKYSVRRPLNWFSKKGTVTFRHLGSVDEILAMLPTLFDQHVARWQGRRTVSVFRDARYREFYAQLVRKLTGKGWLLFSVLALDGRPLALHFGFDYAGTVVWYKPSFDSKYANQSPGLLLIRQLINDSLSRERAEIDFTIGGEEFKARFANVERAVSYLALYHGRLYGTLARVEKSARRAARLVRRSVGSVIRRYRQG